MQERRTRDTLKVGKLAVLHKAVIFIERAMGIEPTTFSLARRRSTDELRPQRKNVASQNHVASNDLACHVARSALRGAEGQSRTDMACSSDRCLDHLGYLGLK